MEVRIVEAGHGAKRRIRWEIPVYFLFFVLSLTLSVHLIVDGDIWWHLKAGEWILENHKIPRTDVFSYTAGDRPWIDLHWLFQVGVALVYRFMGPDGLMAASVLLAMAVAGLMFVVAGGRRLGVAGVLYLALAVLLASERFTLRPHLASAIFLLAYLAILRSKRPGWLWVLPVLQVLWFNTHALAILGFGLIAVYVAGLWAQSILQERFGAFAETPIDRARIGTATKVGAVCLAVLLINPYGVQGALFPLDLYTRIDGSLPVFTYSIGEFVPTLHLGFEERSFHNQYVAFALLGGLAVVFRIRQVRLWEVGVFGLLLFLSIKARRNVFEFAVVAAPLAAGHLDGLTRALASRWEERFGRLGPSLVRAGSSLGSAAVLAALVVLIASNRYYEERLDARRFGWGVSGRIQSPGVVDFLRQVQPARLYNDFNLGGYFLWKLFPEQKVFIDSRLELYGDEFYSYNIRLARRLDVWERESERWGFDAVALADRSDWADPLADKLLFDPRWRLAFVDSGGMVFLRKKEEHLSKDPLASIDHGEAGIEALISREAFGQGCFLGGLLETVSDRCARLIGYRGWHPRADEYGDLGGVLLKVGRPDLAEKAYLAVLELAPRSILARFNLAVTYHRMGRNLPAARLYSELIQEGRRLPSLYTNLAEILLIVGQIEQARNAALVAVGEQPNSVLAHYLLGRIYRESGLWKEAEEELQYVLGRNPSHGLAHREMAYLLWRKNLREEAEVHLRKAAALDRRIDYEGELRSLRKAEITSLSENGTGGSEGVPISGDSNRG
jgi:tetratricopeptide (TPR) repeat protein